MSDSAQNPYATGSTGGSSDGLSQLRMAAKTGSVITLALAMGIVTVSVILGFMASQKDFGDSNAFRLDADSMVFVVIGFGKFLVCVAACVILRSVSKRKVAEIMQSSETPFPVPIREDSKLPPVTKAATQTLFTSTLIGQALFEGGAMLNAILMFLDQNFIFLIPIVLGIAGVLFQMPTESRLRSALENASVAK